MFFKKKKQEDRDVLARIEARFEPTESGHGIAMTIGFFVMVAAVIFESNPIRLVAWCCLWTGWNVLHGFGLIMRKKINFVIYREAPRPPPRSD